MVLSFMGFMGSRALKNFYCRRFLHKNRGFAGVPAPSKISTVVDRKRVLRTASSRALKNFYCRRSEFGRKRASCSRALKNFYCRRFQSLRRQHIGVPAPSKISTVVDIIGRSSRRLVPAPSKISTVVDSPSAAEADVVPAPSKISTVVDGRLLSTRNGFPRPQKFLLS